MGNFRKHPFLNSTGGIFGIPRASGGSLDCKSEALGVFMKCNSEGMGGTSDLGFPEGRVPKGF